MLASGHQFFAGDFVKILIPLLTLLQLSSARASIVAIMDSGTDISHSELSAKRWINSNETAGSLKDLDGDGLPGDVNGWDFTEGSAKVFNDNYNYLITEDVKKFYDYYSRFELGLLTQRSPELAWLKTNTQNEKLMNQVNFVGGYIHGTHVAGISAKNNSEVKLLTMKIIPTVYEELKPEAADPKTLASASSDKALGLTVEEFTTAVIQEAKAQVDEMVSLHEIIDFHNVDVVNQSFGIGFKDAVNFLSTGFTKAIKREPTDAELLKLLKTYYYYFRNVGPKMFKTAPNTVFVIAAGNDSSDNDLYPDFPSDIQADNKLVVAATVGYKSLAEFSNFGATRVDVAAPGVAITSTAPTNAYIALSGTSQATPYVTNTIAAMKDINPKLSAIDLKTIILKTVDVKPWLAGKVKTSGIVNKARALSAAELSKAETLEVAISKANSLIADVQVEKSFTRKLSGIKLNYKPFRPSLLIKK